MSLMKLPACLKSVVRMLMIMIIIVRLYARQGERERGGGGRERVILPWKYWHTLSASAEVGLSRRDWTTTCESGQEMVGMTVK